ncbi:monovalent cation:proton antiporter-2 (CPA2) family protein [Neisseria sp. ZJ106]|uniref:Monovalent cation:proton antiporter-2 (CPA2) family protein n=1 Tax=Neisseria lisongii TaxID=2912188 RepID=A0ABY7RJ77_9NEIS|nr:monovalent cation:proton antiporter family protein [Neisseria lisongii]MCF7521912.1 monovalent cation:proton antiporter-2 (CPA2) family protein [Neisseria lisongii]WCL71125.1 monovalent cation:proton antiporter-2 (CPA2) family protein [Neisseria lisongii]
MHEFSLAPIVIVLLVSVITVIFCRKLNIPSMLGYLLVGFIAGPSMLHLIPKNQATDYLGEIGIVFLMFSIGLEFSLPKLKAMRRLVFGLGGLQVVITMLSVMGVLMALDTPFNWAFATAGALAMSSTAIVSRILSEKTELGQPHGQMAMGVLLMQDIAVVPLMILIPALAGGSSGNLWAELGWAALKMIATLSILFLIGNRVMSPWFRMVAKRKSSELFMINVLLVTLGVAYLTELEGLSLALGAFVAGMLLSETEYRFQVEDDIRPFRDILLGFFFITVGMKLDLQALISDWQLILVLLAILVLLKALVVFIIAHRMRNPVGDSLKAALYLAQGGEFGFVMLAISSKINMVSTELEQAATAAVLLSMVIAPFLLESSDKIVNRFVKSSWDMKALNLHTMLVATMNKSDHVLIIGFGRGGQTVGRILAEQNIPYFALDLDVERVQIARSAGEPVSFGDAKRREVLEAAGLGRAKMVVLTLNNMHETQHVLNNIISMHPSMPVYARAINDDYVGIFTDMGAEEAVSDTKETSLALAGYAMLAHGAPYNKVYQTITNIRRSRYASLGDLFSGSDDDTGFSEEGKTVVRYAFALSDNAAAVGKTIAQLPIQSCHIRLLFVRRNTGRIDNLAPEFVLQTGDILVVAGKKEEIISFENWSLQGHF